MTTEYKPFVSAQNIKRINFDITMFGSMDHLDQHFCFCLQCLMHLENRLQELYLRSKMLTDYIRFHPKLVPEDLVNKFE